LIFSVHGIRFTEKLFYFLHLPVRAPTAFETPTVLTSMLAHAVTADPEAALITDKPSIIFRQRLPAVLAGDEAVRHNTPSNTR
jgi:hypothetical protein